MAPRLKGVATSSASRLGGRSCLLERNGHHDGGPRHLRESYAGVGSHFGSEVFEHLGGDCHVDRKIAEGQPQNIRHNSRPTSGGQSDGTYVHRYDEHPARSDRLRDQAGTGSDLQDCGRRAEVRNELRCCLGPFGLPLSFIATVPHGRIVDMVGSGAWFGTSAPGHLASSLNSSD